MLIAAVAILGLYLYPLRPQKTDYVLPRPPLKELAAKHGVSLGNHAIYVRIYETAYSRILTKEHDFVTLDNTPNWHFIGYDLRPSRDEYNFSQMDELVAYAQAQQMPMQAHHLLWGEEKWLPDWLKNGNYSTQELDLIIHEHIKTVAGRYQGRIGEWTVVNEAFTRGQHRYGLSDWWTDATGSKDYIEKSFVWARQADPQAVLILNDFNNEVQNEVSDEMYDYLKSALARGVPINAIGMQMHIDGSSPPSKEAVITNMQRFADLGLKVYVTEFDVNMGDVEASYSVKAEREGTIYYDMMRACIESRVCQSFAMLGITDKETWYNYMGIQQPMPLMFDENYAPKPAFYGLRRALE